MNIFFSVAMADIPTLKTMPEPTPFLSVLSLESLTIAACYKFHKSPKTAIGFETSFFLAKPNENPTFHGRRFSV